MGSCHSKSNTIPVRVYQQRSQPSPAPPAIDTSPVLIHHMDTVSTPDPPAVLPASTEDTAEHVYPIQAASSSFSTTQEVQPRTNATVAVQDARFTPSANDDAATVAYSHSRSTNVNASRPTSVPSADNDAATIVLPMSQSYGNAAVSSADSASDAATVAFQPQQRPVVVSTTGGSFDDDDVATLVASPGPNSTGFALLAPTCDSECASNIPGASEDDATKQYPSSPVPAGRALSPVAPPQPVDWAPGMDILNTYQVQQLLGKGGMGSVYRVFHKGWRKTMVVKSPHLHFASSKETLISEIESWVSLGMHPNIVCAFYVREIDGLLRIFAEEVTGGSVQDWIDKGQLYQGDAVQVTRRLLSFAIQASRGVYYAHKKGLIHQDIKPDNIMVAGDGTCKITDFGLASSGSDSINKVATANPTQSTAETAELSTPFGGGTRGYWSPEQAQCFEKLSHNHHLSPNDPSLPQMTVRTDIYCLGVTFLHMLTGKRVWRQGHIGAEQLIESARQYCSGSMDIGYNPFESIPEFMSIIAKCTQLDPNNRYQSVKQLVNDMTTLFSNKLHDVFPADSTESEFHLETGASLNNRAMSMFDIGRAEAAKQLWARALEVDPTLREPSFNFNALKYMHQEITDWEFESLVSRDAPLLARLCAAQGRWIESLKVYDGCLNSLSDADRAKALESIGQIKAISTQQNPKSLVMRLGCLFTLHGTHSGHAKLSTDGSRVSTICKEDFMMDTYSLLDVNQALNLSTDRADNYVTPDVYKGKECVLYENDMYDTFRLRPYRVLVYRFSPDLEVKHCLFLDQNTKEVTYVAVHGTQSNEEAAKNKIIIPEVPDAPLPDLPEGEERPRDRNEDMKKMVLSFAVSQDGALLAYANLKQFSVFDISDKNNLQRIFTEPYDPTAKETISYIESNPAMTYIMVDIRSHIYFIRRNGSQFTTVKMTTPPLPEGEKKQDRRGDFLHSAIRFDSNGRLYLATDKGHVYIFSPEKVFARSEYSWTELLASGPVFSVRAHAQTICDITMHPQGFVAFASLDSSVSVWKAETSRRKNTAEEQIKLNFVRRFTDCLYQFCEWNAIMPIVNTLSLGVVSHDPVLGQTLMRITLCKEFAKKMLADDNMKTKRGPGLEVVEFVINPSLQNAQLYPDLLSAQSLLSFDDLMQASRETTESTNKMSGALAEGQLTAALDAYKHLSTIEGATSRPDVVQVSRRLAGRLERTGVSAVSLAYHHKFPAAVEHARLSRSGDEILVASDLTLSVFNTRTRKTVVSTTLEKRFAALEVTPAESIQLAASLDENNGLQIWRRDDLGLHCGSSFPMTGRLNGLCVTQRSNGSNLLLTLFGDQLSIIDLDASVSTELVTLHNITITTNDARTGREAAKSILRVNRVAQRFIVYREFLCHFYDFDGNYLAVIDNGPVVTGDAAISHWTVLDWMDLHLMDNGFQVVPLIHDLDANEGCIGRYQWDAKRYAHTTRHGGTRSGFLPKMDMCKVFDHAYGTCMAFVSPKAVFIAGSNKELAVSACKPPHNVERKTVLLDTCKHIEASADGCVLLATFQFDKTDFISLYDIRWELGPNEPTPEPLEEAPSVIAPGAEKKKKEKKKKQTSRRMRNDTDEDDDDDDGEEENDSNSKQKTVWTPLNEGVGTNAKQDTPKPKPTAEPVDDSGYHSSEEKKATPKKNKQRGEQTPEPMEDVPRKSPANANREADHDGIDEGTPRARLSRRKKSVPYNLPPVDSP